MDEKLCTRRPFWQRSMAAALAGAGIAALAAAPVLGIAPAAPEDADAAAGAVDVNLPIFEVEPTLEAVSGHERAELADFFGRWSGNWEVRWDRRADRPNVIQGQGIPLLPGKGNQLAGDPARRPNLEQVGRLAAAFATRESALLGTAGLDLRLDRSRSLPYGAGDYLWTVELQQFHQGVPVEDAHVYFRINHGNIVQFGNHRVVPVTIDAHPSYGAAEAFAAGLAAAGVTAPVRERLDRGVLKIFPVLDEGEAIAEAFAGAAGQGYRHLLAWEFQYRLADDHLYRLRVDAKTGRAVQLADLTSMASVTANIYPTTNTDPLVSVGLPYVNVSNGTAKVTDAAGNYTYGSGTASTTLNGKYFKMTDNCGAISLSASSPGNLALGGAGGTDCTTPGFGGAGNTHSSRTGFYHLTKINRKAAGFLPANTWLTSTVTANMNINSTCNAFWNGSTVNFYRSGGGCSNTGEIAAIFLHEWGHGIDANTGGAASDQGSGEAVGDTFAFLETKDACIGKNFQPGVPCANCNASCTGVRDLSAFALGGISTIAKPSNVTSNTGINCDRWACPYRVSLIFPYQGPMGYEGHCESYIASTANWDLAQSLVGKYGATAGWAATDKIWYGSLTPSKSAYRVASGGKCNAAATVDGCASSNWYTVYLPADDDDGNLANGTPNACRIWDAFNAHGIACGARPVCTVP